MVNVDGNTWKVCAKIERILFSPECSCDFPFSYCGRGIPCSRSVTSLIDFPISVPEIVCALRMGITALFPRIPLKIVPRRRSVLVRDKFYAEFDIWGFSP